MCAFSSVKGDLKKFFYLIDGGLGCNDTPPYTNLEKTLREKKRLKQGKTKGETVLDLDAIIITHPDKDHYGGVNDLIAKYTINCPIITTEATKLTEATLTDVKLELHEEVNLMFPNASRRVYSIAKTTRIMKDPDFTMDSNKSSILFAVGSVLLTGDSTGKLIHQETRPAEMQKLRVFQVPHHGSAANSFIPNEARTPIPITDPLNPLKGKHPAYKYALFYRKIQAQTYFISHGDYENYQHPHRDVITGILLAAVTERKTCELVVTGTFHNDKIDYPTTTRFPDFPQNWEDYVTIRIPEHGDDTPYITIDQEGRPLNTKRWEPELSAR